MKPLYQKLNNLTIKNFTINKLVSEVVLNEFYLTQDNQDQFELLCIAYKLNLHIFDQLIENYPVQQLKSSFNLKPIQMDCLETIIDIQQLIIPTIPLNIQGDQLLRLVIGVANFNNLNIYYDRQYWESVLLLAIQQN